MSDFPSRMDQALDFLASFPEAVAFHVTCLSQDKKHCLVNRQSVGRQALIDALPQWLSLNQTHVFIRPLIGSLVFLDLDTWNGSIQSLIDLKARVVTCTSRTNYQAWFCIDHTLTAKTAAYVQKSLVSYFQADVGACSRSQQGRLPGSKNCKPGRENQAVYVVYRSTDNLDEATFLQRVPKQTFRLEDGKIVMQPVPSRSKRVEEDRSGQDWHMCCSFWESNPGATMKEAEEALRNSWKAVREHQQYYQKLTLEKSREHTVGASGTAGGCFFAFLPHT